MEEDQELQNPFPSPPSHYTNYTSHNLRLLSLLKSRLSEVESVPDTERVQQQRDLLANETDVPEWPLLQLEKPRADWILEEGAYNAFGDTWFTKERIPSLAEMGGTQLYPEDPTVDRRPALQAVLKTLLRTYSSFLSSILSPPPPQTSGLPPDWQRLVEWMRVMGQNIMGAANDLRPVQARGNLEAMMTRQLELRREETKKIHAKCDVLEERLKELRDRVVTLAEPKHEQNPEVDTTDVDIHFGGTLDVPKSPVSPVGNESSTTVLPNADIDSKEAIQLAPVTDEDLLRWAEEVGKLLIVLSPPRTVLPVRVHSKEVLRTCIPLVSAPIHNNIHGGRVVGVDTLLSFLMHLVKKNKRKLIDSQDESDEGYFSRKRSRASRACTFKHETIVTPEVQDHDICARLITTTDFGRRDAVLISIEKPVTIGRNPRRCSYVITDPAVSNVHFKVFAIRSSSGAILLSFTDTSTNGTQLNGHLIKKASVILVHGDVLSIKSSQTFQCVYAMPAMRQQKQTLFDPTPPSEPVDKAVGNYIVTSYMLGSGAFATVNLAYTISRTGPHGANNFLQVACKMVKMTSEAEKSKFMKEVDLLKRLSHPNINRIRDVVVQDGFLNIFLELSTGGDLFNYITSRSMGRMKEGEARYCGFQLMVGLQYLHTRNVSHRDLKPENILLHMPGPFPRLIIADFGLARGRAHEQTLNAVGTLSYMSPEAIRALTTPHHGYVGIYADAWSLGLVLHTMLCGCHPFDRADAGTRRATSASERNDARVMARILDAPIALTDPLWDSLPSAHALVRRLLMHNLRERETVRGALASRWIQEELGDLKEGYRARVGPYF